MQRFEFREDRLKLSEWVKTYPPARNITYSHQPLGLFIRISKWLDGREYCIENVLTHVQLETMRLGWRWLVSQELRRMRYKFRKVSRS
jgi:hypothetical protein